MSHTLMLGQDAPSVTGWLAAPSKMLDWFKGQMQAFFMLPANIAATRRKGEALREVLKQKGDAAGATQVEGALHNLSRVAVNHASLQSRVSDLFSKLGALGIKMPGLSGDMVTPVGFGNPIAIPAALLIAGGAVALGIAYLFADYRKQVGLIDQVASGRLTAEEAAKLGARPLFGLDLGKLMLPLVAIAGFFLLRAGRRRTSW